MNLICVSYRHEVPAHAAEVDSNKDFSHKIPMQSTTHTIQGTHIRRLDILLHFNCNAMAISRSDGTHKNRYKRFSRHNRTRQTVIRNNSRRIRGRPISQSKTCNFRIFRQYQSVARKRSHLFTNDPFTNDQRKYYEK